MTSIKLKNNIKIATRRSPLALWQSEHVKSLLINEFPDLDIELHTMTTQGDKMLDAPLAKLGGKGLFVKELEKSLLDGDTDIAVHSMKDVPVEFPSGLHLPVILPRENPCDAFVSNKYETFDELPSGAILGTSSLRRQAQLQALRPDIEIRSLRGNVGTRLQRLDEGKFDAIILASAGLIRLGFTDRITQILPTEVCLPAIGQGAIGIECRCDDEQVANYIKALNDNRTKICVQAERALNKRLEGGCQVPIAGHAAMENDLLILRGLVGWPDGSAIITGSESGTPDEALSMGDRLAEDLLSRGADQVLKALYST